MIRFFVFFFFIPIFSSAQSNISINIIERTDATKELKRIFNYSLESYIYKNITLGLTNAKASADYIKEGYSPIQDSLVISNYQIFSKYYVLNNLFFLIQSPISTNNKRISVFERIRVGGGYYFYFKNNITYYVSYNMLLNPNDNGFEKGKFTLGVSILMSGNY